MSGSPGLDDDKQPLGRAGSACLLPLVPLYSAIVALKNTAYARRWLPIDRLQAPVISIGNLSVGGAGKTPLVIRIAELLTLRGFDVDVLSRGYGRRSDAVEQVLPAGPDPTRQQGGAGQQNLAGQRDRAGRGDRAGEKSPAERYGDEPLLIAEATRVPVYVGASRYAAGLLAEQRPGPGARVHLLDDGFQHRRFARAVDIVVLHRSDFSEQLLPAGRLREPLSSLRRASIAVLRVEDAAFEPELRRRFPALPVWRIAREISLPPGAAVPACPEALAGERKAIAFCGIAHPEEFFASLTRAGVSIAQRHAYPDHHSYTSADIAVLVRSVKAAGACRLLTTEKDLVRLSAAHQSELTQALREAAQTLSETIAARPASLEAVPLRVRLLDEEAALVQLLALAGLAGATMRKSEFA